MIADGLTKHLPSQKHLEVLNLSYLLTQLVFIDVHVA